MIADSFYAVLGLSRRLSDGRKSRNLNRIAVVVSLEGNLVHVSVRDSSTSLARASGSSDRSVGAEEPNLAIHILSDNHDIVE